MKKTLLRSYFKEPKMLIMIFVLLLQNNLSFSQIVTIPDPNFAAWLQTNYPTCITGNQLDTQCPDVLTTNSINVTNQNISDLTGIEHFVELNFLYCWSNSLTFLPTLPDSLYELYCYDNQLTSLPDLPVDLQILNCHLNSLTSLPELPDGLYLLDISYNPDLQCLPVLPNSLETVGQIWHSLNIVNTQVDCIPNLPILLYNMSGQAICGFNDPLTNPDGCWSSTTISGKVYADNVANCSYDLSESGVAYTAVYLYDLSNNLVGYTYTDNDGDYTLFGVMPGDYKVIVDTSVVYFDYNCLGTIPEYTVSINNFDQLTGYDFAATCLSFVENEIYAVFPVGFVFPGQNHNLWTHLLTTNLCSFVGNSGELKFTFSGDVTYVGPAMGSLTPTSVIGNTVTYDVADFNLVVGSGHFGIELATNTTATIGDSICATVEIFPDLADIDLTNNVFQICYAVGNSYDPNTKEVYPVNVLPGYDDWLTYTVKFQNTGTAAAMNIKVMDTLDANLKPETIQVMYSSHSSNLYVNGDVATFFFNDIMLPDSTSDPLGSIGTIQFRVKPESALPIGTVIENEVDIYFDFNAPVTTNTAFTYYNQVLGVNDPALNDFILYPNPVNDVLYLKADFEDHTILTIYNMHGEVIRTYSGVLNSINVNDLAPGMYILSIADSQNILKQTFVKQ
jgi:uncharacterized repeat protein (TIGR01451 family)